MWYFVYFYGEMMVVSGCFYEILIFIVKNSFSDRYCMFFIYYLFLDRIFCYIFVIVGGRYLDLEE